MAGQEPVTFGRLLRELRTDAGLTQEELAEAAGLSPRSVSDLERGINLTARKDTARLLAGALNLTGQAREEFEALSRGRIPVRDSKPSGVAATRTLPRDVASFTGRETELRELADATVGAAGTSGLVGIQAIGGMAGVGKTALAVHAAHQLAPRFPDGQLFLPLHGHTPGQRPVDPADALASLLMTTGVSAAQIPPGLEARMALWRDRLAGRQLLLILDDAVGSDQIRPLLPGTGGSLVLVTSRRRLSALDDAMTISLDILPPDEAAGLLVRLAARPDLDPADAVAGEITQLCGYLPLAIGMLARQLHHHPAWTPADLAAELRATQDRLQLMTTEHLSAAAAFDLSYKDLAERDQRMFRRLGLHPGTDIDAYAAAALDDTDLPVARRQLDTLYSQYLLTEPSRGRYRLHDLLREHARALAARDDTDNDREQAIGRLLGFYQHTAERASRHFIRYTRPGFQSGPIAPASPALTTSAEALEWLHTEQANLLAGINDATEHLRRGWIVSLTASLAIFLRQEGPWPQAVDLHAAAAVAAQGDGDRLGEANARYDLANIRYMTGDYEAAAGVLGQALDLYRDAGNLLGEANCLWELSRIRDIVGDRSAAGELLEQGLQLYQKVGDRIGQANVFHALCRRRSMHGDFPAAADLERRASQLYHEAGNRIGVANSLSELGRLSYATGDYPQASDLLERSLKLYRDLGNRLGEANNLTDLGQVRYLTGDYPAAARLFEKALIQHRDLGNRLGEANSLHMLGRTRGRAGDYAAATGLLEQALNLYLDIGGRNGQAYSFHELGRIRYLTGDYPAAAGLLERAMSLFRDLGDLSGQAEALNSTGDLLAERSQLAERSELLEALAAHQQALELARRAQNPLEEARALEGAARRQLAIGDRQAARAGLRAAAALYQRINPAQALLTAEYLSSLE